MRLLVVEGIPGSGKTTAVAAASRWFSARGLRVQAFEEGAPHPADLAWQWWFSHDDFQAACRDHPSAASELRRCAWVSPAGVAVAYTKIDPQRCGAAWPGLEAAMRDREPYEGRLPAPAFVELLVSRWRDFGAVADDPAAPDVAIFDGSLLQNTLIELVLHAQHSGRELVTDLLPLCEAVSACRPVVVRLVPADLRAALAAATGERVDDRGFPQWRDAVEAYVAATPWARAHRATAPNALSAYLVQRQQLEAEILPELPVHWIDVVSPAGTAAPWDEFEQRFRQVLTGLLG